MILLSGIKIRDNRREGLFSQINEIKKREGDKFIPPTLVIFQVGENKSSGVYIEQKKKFATYIGAEVLHIKLGEQVEESEIIAEIKNYNIDDSVHGIIVQLPLPRHLSVSNITNSIDYKKDVDGLSSTSLGLLAQRNFKNDKNQQDKNSDEFKKTHFEGFIPATAKGVLSLLEEHDIDVDGKKVCILGRSVLVGKPIALTVLAKNATITVCHSKTNKIEELTKAADIIISAVGTPGFITKDFVSSGQKIIDVGISSVEVMDENGEIVRKLFGDVDFENVFKIVSAITPVPGGVGPLTVVSLFENLFESFCNTLI